MNTDELHDLAVATLLREAGGTRRRWRLAVGQVRVYSIATHPHCNWTVNPSGSAGDIAAVERVVDKLRAQHPIVTN